MNDIGSVALSDSHIPSPRRSYYPTAAQAPTTISASSNTLPSHYSQVNNHRNPYSSTYLYATQPHSSPIHTLHSEWLDSNQNSPINSPSKDPKMSVTVTQNYQTPVKPKVTAYMTPDTDNKTSSININERLLSRSSSTSQLVDDSTSAESSQLVHKPATAIPTMDIFWAMLNNITGKDKMAKVGQYLLRLLIYHANQTKDYLSDETINIGSIDKSYNDRSKKLNLIANFVRHPVDFARIVVILVCSRFSTRFQGMVNGLSTYRQFLRFGKTPFRVRDLATKLQDAFAHNTINSTALTKKTLGEVIGLYYGFNDECLLLYKLGLLTNKSFKKVVSRHESLAWYYDSILGIYTAVDAINTLSQQEMDLKIQIQVKNKAKLLSKQILGLKSNSDTSSLASLLNESSNSRNHDAESLKQIQFQKFNAYLDLYKWMSDFVFDSYTVFHMKLPFNTLQIWFGLIASSLSTFKIYRETSVKMAAKK
ncbi:hypothetical protein CANTEDRAFT_116874 [Yamadazyma tenuis ATCC 10573]|uniref:Uncharacterized protein n=1 Tax=Candida tenuis (strain ATCC 10573 / BCRC 21748 / CBS 615 / JCM 9827 / NBRC 10315 / NRRL Y-1498 / VKM Y-70) TaxID=590646 RepID=G3BCD6_CANTC|nr:uncharacterized protein CANTEDRAFT_116874 [Yamadazyma tenuis ATCC 10573]XP_006690479.1 uncharacterized protein CANTEDRAFT_116874 [Yamadazyma tenuis ATCC 10573]EGV61264.1 hypothetical protein CANTEDRAFT_116874 [Yamadazyma tenuis ATCC 10573]EGV61265.1 hypothetical protein CANTEDRAFT_116874 [Yamadazyma tenuis ATCC 10573]